MDEDSKLPLKRVEFSLTKFNEVEIPHLLDLLRQHKANIIKYEELGELVRARAEQTHARRVASQLRGLLHELDALRRQVREADRARFDALTQRSRDNTLRAIVDYLGTSPLSIKRGLPEAPPVAASAVSTESVGLVAHGDDATPPEFPTQIQLHVEDQVTEVEIRAVVRRLSAKNTAPGPDGLPGKAWVLAMKALGSRLRGLFSACMERGQFPLRWKTGKLVLIAKPGRPADAPSAYRPIVLLDEAVYLQQREELQRGFSELQTELHALHDAWQCMQAAALAQRHQVSLSAASVDAAADNVSAARAHLAAGERLRAGAWGASGAALGLLAGGPVGLAVGAKAGALAAAAGSLLGFLGARVLGRRAHSAAPPLHADKDGKAD